MSRKKCVRLLYHFSQWNRRLRTWLRRDEIAMLQREILPGSGGFYYRKHPYVAVQDFRAWRRVKAQYGLMSE